MTSAVSPLTLGKITSGREPANFTTPEVVAKRRRGRPKGARTQAKLTVAAIREMGDVALPRLRAAIEMGDLGAIALWARCAVPSPKSFPIDPLPGYPPRPVVAAESCAEAANVVAAAVGDGRLSTDDAKAMLDILAKAAVLAGIRPADETPDPAMLPPVAIEYHFVSPEDAE